MNSDEEVIMASQEVEDILEMEGSVAMMQNEGVFSQLTTENDSDQEVVAASQEVEDMLQIEKAAKRLREPVTDNYLQEMARSAEPKNTLKRNKWAVNAFYAWAVTRNNQRTTTNKEVIPALEVMSPKQLNYWLSKFVCEILKQDGSEYPPKSLLSLCMGIQGYLRVNKKVNLNILRSPDFEDFRQVLDGRMKGLTREGVGSAARQAQPFTPEEENMFWRKKILGDHNARTLLRTILYLNGKHFALRSGDEHRALRYINSQITLHEKDGEEYLEYTEDMSKTNQGGLKHLRVKPKSVRIYQSEDPDRCHIRLYKLYMKMSPQSGRDGAFYLTPLQKPQQRVWYSRQAVGHNTLQRMVPDIAKAAGLQGHYTNHSLRSTAATALFQAGVDEQLIMKQTGHRSVSGVRTYKRVNEEQMKMVSSILTSKKSKPEQVLCRAEPKTSAPEKTSSEETSDDSVEPEENGKKARSRGFQFINCNVQIL